jgi:predicted nucleic acid-binding protein
MTVVDASVWVSRLVPGDPSHATSRAWLEAQVARGDLLVSPALLLPEVAGALVRRTGLAVAARRAIAQLLRLPAVRLVAVDERVAREAGRLAARLRLRGADAVYVAVARLLRLPLVTLDHEQERRAGEAIVVRQPSRA